MTVVAVPRRRVGGGEGRMAYLLLLPTLVLLALVVGFPLVLSAWQSLMQTGKGIDPTTGLISRAHPCGLENYPRRSPRGCRCRVLERLLEHDAFTVVGVSTDRPGVRALIMAKAGPRSVAFDRPGRSPRPGTDVAADFHATASRLIGTRCVDHRGLAGQGRVRSSASEDLPSSVAYPRRAADHRPAGLRGGDRRRREPWQIFWRITLPLVTVLVVAVLFRLLDAMRMFDPPYVLLGRLAPADPHAATVRPPRPTSAWPRPTDGPVRLHLLVAFLAELQAPT